MSKSKQHNAFPDWNFFEKLFHGDVQSLLPELAKLPQRDSAWIQDYITNMLNNINNTKTDKLQMSQLDFDLFQTHRSIICRIPVPKEINPNYIRTWVNTNYIQVEGVDSAKKKHTIPLPEPILTKSCRALYKNNILEIRLRKRDQKRKYREVYVEFAD